MTLGAFSQHLLFATGLALLSAAVVRAMIRWPILDVPNARSAHAVATPRGGGLGVVVAFMAGMLVLYRVADVARLEERQFLGVILAAIAIAGVALADDIRNLSARLRLLAQVAAALVAVATGHHPDAAGDALDRGGGTGLRRHPADGVLDRRLHQCGEFHGWAGRAGRRHPAHRLRRPGGDLHRRGRAVRLCRGALMAAGFAGFLPFNLHPARIFMGDVGSQFAGFMLAVLAVAAARFDFNRSAS